MTTIMTKQHKILGEMYQLRKRNRELQIECDLQREYHSMERNALVKELHDVKTFSRDRLFDAVSSNFSGSIYLVVLPHYLSLATNRNRNRMSTIRHPIVWII